MTPIDAWPLFGLTIRTPRLELRIPTEPELVELAEVAAGGVHREDERPFLTPGRRRHRRSGRGR